MWRTIDSITDQKIAVFCGLVDLEEIRGKEMNIDYLSEVSEYVTNIDDSIKNAGIYLEKATEDFALAFLK